MGRAIQRSEAECVDHYPTTESFIGSEPIVFRFFAWLYVDRHDRTWLIDTGCTKLTAKAFGKTVEYEIPELIDGCLNLRPSQIDNVILTHLHYDHADNIEPFVNARFFVQKSELAHLHSPALGRFNGDEFYVDTTRQKLATLAEQKRLCVIDGPAQIDDAVLVFPLPGHTPGLQGVKLDLPDGSVALASDAAHVIANLQTGRPFPKSFDVDQGVGSIRNLRRLESEGVVIMPGHALPSSIQGSVQHVQARPIASLG